MILSQIGPKQYNYHEGTLLLLGSEKNLKDWKNED